MGGKVGNSKLLKVINIEMVVYKLLNQCLD